MSRPHRVLLVGYGRIARRHVSAIRELATFALCGVVEPSKDVKEGVPVWRDLTSALVGCSPDLVVITSPSGLHAEHARAALQCGAHVICEKPLAMCAADVDELVDLAKDRLLLPCFQTRHYPIFRHLSHALEQGLLGRVHTVNMSLQWCRPQRYFDEEPWRGSRRHDGGVLFNQASHLLDWSLSVVDEIREVFAWEDVLRRDVEAPDSVAALWRWRGGMGTISATVLAQPANFAANLSVLGDRGACRLGGVAGQELVAWEVPDSPLSREAIAELNARTLSVRQRGHAPLYERVASWLESGDWHEARAFQRGAQRVARCLDLVRESSRLGQPVPWSLDLLQAVE